MHCLCIIFTLSVCLSFVTGRETKQIPSTGFNKQGIFKPLAATGTIAGLFLGKRLIDGPVFNDAVSLKGKNVVITGANSGLGRATAEKLASLGANMYLFCKSPEKGDATVTEIRAKTGNNNVYNIPMDLRSLKSVATAAKELGDRLDNVHILVNNAGVMALPKRTETEDGFEAHLGINHLGHFAFTGQILPLLMKDDNTDSSPKRIVSVASAAHYFGKIDRDNLMLTKPGSYEPWPAYGNSKQANILFTTALAKKLQSLNQDPARKTQIIAACCHPGNMFLIESSHYVVEFISSIDISLLSIQVYVALS